MFSKIFIQYSSPLLACLALLFSSSRAVPDDWPTYAHDNQRSGISREDLAPPLSEIWTFASLHPPAHAWGDPQPKPVEKQLELPRSRFDDAFQTAAVGDLVYFGSSADNTIYALEAATGDVRWKLVTDGPVRLAPTVWEDKVYVGSDDGRVYCLDAATGRALWIFNAAPTPERLLGNGKIISLWPVRTGVLVDDGIAYFGAGVFPAEGVFLYAVRARDGSVIWKNDSFGRGGQGTISPQGYMLASSDKLFVASGRTMPGAFSRKDGSLLYHRNFNWRDIGMSGGTTSLLAGDLLYNGVEQLLAVKTDGGNLEFTEGVLPSVPTEGTRRFVVDGDMVYLFSGKDALAAVRPAWVAQKKVDTLKRKLADAEARVKANPRLASILPPLRKGLEEMLASRAPLGDPLKWKVPCGANDSVAFTGRFLFAGGADAIAALDASSGAQVWSAPVQGKARGLAIARGRLFVSTDRGSIHCFAPGQAATPRRIAPSVSDPFGPDGESARYASTADAIVTGSGVRRGHALTLGAGTGRLALEIVRRTELTVQAVETDPGNVARAREALTQAGVHGPRVVVTQSSLEAIPFPDYFANLIVCEDGLRSGVPATPAPEVLRMLKPCGGVAFVGRTAGAADRTIPAALEGWIGELRTSAGGPEALAVSAEGGLVKVVRGPLPGAADWTHQYAGPGNTASSEDQLVRGPMGILWYGEPGPGRMPSRHSANVAPLVVGEKVFIQAENAILAHDMYNGLSLWERELPGPARLGMQTSCSDLAAGKDGLFVAAGSKCQRLDLETGKTLKTYAVPPSKDGSSQSWLYVAHSGGLLFGSRGASALFAVDVESGDLRWVHEAGQIQLTAVCLGDGRAYFVDRQVSPAQKAEALRDVVHEKRVDRKGNPVEPDVRLVVCLDAASGQRLWERPLYVSDCVGVGAPGGELSAMCSNGVLVLCGQPWNGHFWKEFFAGEFSRRSLVALSGGDGKLLWSGRKGYRSRPLIVGYEVIAEPWAYDLRTGENKLRIHPVTGAESRWQIARPGHHCGAIAASAHSLFFRSGTTARYDLIDDSGTAHFGAHRPGCWINCIPAGGILVMPEASSGCVCPFSIHCTIAFKPRKENRAWGMFSAPGSLAPVKHLAVSFGSPGDRRDSRGTLWLSYPRPYGGVTQVERRLVLDLPLEVETQAGGGFFSGGGDFVAVEGTDDDWLYASGVKGLKRCSIPVGKAALPPRSYTVRLHFREVEKGQIGERVFDVLLEGQPLLKGLDILKEAGDGRRAVIKEIKGVRAAEKLELAFQPVQGAPILSGVEILAEE